MLKEGVIRVLKVIVSAIALSLLVGCTKYETPSQKYMREYREELVQKTIEREKRHVARAKEDKFSFFGIQIEDSKNDYDFVREEGTYRWIPSKMNKNIYAMINYVAPSDDSFTIRIYNKADKPFSTNYFSDKFSLFTKDNRKYILDNGDIGSYPEYEPDTSGYINPNDNMGVKLSLPSGVDIANVKKFIVNMGWDIRIVLKPDLHTSKSVKGDGTLLF